MNIGITTGPNKIPVIVPIQIILPAISAYLEPLYHKAIIRHTPMHEQWDNHMSLLTMELSLKHHCASPRCLFDLSIARLQNAPSGTVADDIFVPNEQIACYSAHTK